jgi:hypothetical protein
VKKCPSSLGIDLEVLFERPIITVKVNPSTQPFSDSVGSLKAKGKHLRDLLIG